MSKKRENKTDDNVEVKSEPTQNKTDDNVEVKLVRLKNNTNFTRMFGGMRITAHGYSKPVSVDFANQILNRNPVDRDSKNLVVEG